MENPVIFGMVTLVGLGFIAGIVIMAIRLSSRPQEPRPIPPVNPTEWEEPPTVPRIVPTKLLQARLTVKNGPKRGLFYDIKGNEASIGRARENQVVLDDPTISRTHAGIYRDKDRFVIYDKGASQGLYVNGQDVSGSSAFLDNGSMIQMGEAILQFNVIEVPV